MANPGNKQQAEIRSNPLRSEGPGGALMRRALPAAVAALAILSLLRWLGQEAGLYGTTTGIVSMTITSIAIVGGLLWHFAGKLDRAHAAQLAVDADLRASSRHFELSSDMLCTAGFDGVFRRVNRAWSETLGWSEEELCSRPFVEFVHPDDREKTEKESEGLAAGDVTVDFTNRYATKDGGWRWIDWRAVANLEEGVIYASARDVTDRKALDAKLGASELQNRQILETANDAFISIDAEGCVVNWNPMAEKTFGWSREEAMGCDLSEMIVPQELRDAHRGGLRRAAENGGEGKLMGQILKLPALHRDGHEFPIELTLSPLATADGLTFNAFARDITEREASAQLLERQRRQLVEAQTIGQFGSWEWDAETDKVEWSDQLCRIFGVEPGSAPSTFEGFLDRIHPDDREATKAALGTAFEAAEPFSFEHRVVRPDKTVAVIHARGEVVTAADGKATGMLGTGEDVTERREVERAKDEFTSIVSHELRTPLTSIRGSLGLLESGVLGALPENGQRMIEIAVENTDRLIRLINDILDIERIDSGKIDMHKEVCDGAELVACAIEGLEAFASEGEVTLRADAVPVAVLADRDRILQTLTNLISNAVKFSPAQGTVEVSCEGRDGEVVFSVSDRGRGIPENKQEAIFERFQQVDASDSREKGGTGLGLAISQTIVENHGGRIWVESTAGEGSTFSFALPAVRERANVPDGESSRGSTVLVCDDDASVVEVVRTMLEQRGYRVLEATSGKQALERAASERPDVILLDLLMPRMSGWETASALRAQPETHHIPVIALSVLSQDEAEAPQAPLFAWLQKPVNEDALFATLERALASRPEPFRVLVVEDDRDLAGVLTATMESEGIQAFVAADGQQAIELSQQVRPDLLVLDVGLPEADGFEVVEWLRRHERLNSLPVIVYTARNLDDSDRERLRLGNTTEFLVKGQISPKDFQERVMGSLARIARSRELEREDEPETHLVG